MKSKLNILKVLLLLVVLATAMAFSNERNNERSLGETQVAFIGENDLFITQSAVSKLLIQNIEGAANKTKRIIDLNELESALKSNQMIRNAEVYIDIDGDLIAEVEQKKPLARVLADQYYIDDTGSKMPLSRNYSARVPLVTGVLADSADVKLVYTIAKKVESDEFLKQHITEIQKAKGPSIKLRLRTNNIIVELGDTTELDKKFNNLKAFYQKAKKDKIIENYSKLNLRFASQVICTKT